MIDWPKLLIMASLAADVGVSERYERLRDWIANRINKRLAGYEAMKKSARYIECGKWITVGDIELLRMAGDSLLDVAQKAEADYEENH